MNAVSLTMLVTTLVCVFGVVRFCIEMRPDDNDRIVDSHKISVAELMGSDSRLLCTSVLGSKSQQGRGNQDRCYMLKRECLGKQLV